MRLRAVLAVGILCLGGSQVIAQDAQAEKTIIANERAVNEAKAQACHGRAAKLPYAGLNRIRFEGSVSTAGPGRGPRYPRFRAN